MLKRGRLAAIAAFVLGLLVGAFAQKRHDERVLLPDLHARIDEAASRCDAANEGIARAILEYRGKEPLD